MMSQSPEKYSQQTRPPVKQQAGEEQSQISSAAAKPDSFSLVCEGTEATLRNNLRAARTRPEALTHGRLPNRPTLTRYCSQTLL